MSPWYLIKLRLHCHSPKHRDDQFTLIRYNYLVLRPSEILLMDGQGHGHCISRKTENNKNKKLHNPMKWQDNCHVKFNTLGSILAI